MHMYMYTSIKYWIATTSANDRKIKSEIHVKGLF